MAEEGDESIASESAVAHGHRSSSHLILTIAGLCAMGLATCALYIPFLQNKLVFDDGTLFTSLSVFDFAQTPFNLLPRTFPYFTLGFTEVMWHSIVAHRIVSLVLHLLNAFMIFRLSKVIMRQINDVSEQKSIGLALLAANMFALHPVAVYGAAYLVERTIVLATLFSLLSIWFYWRSLKRDHPADCITAALMYALAVFSKEHAIMLPAAAVAASPIFVTGVRKYAPKAALYLALCIPSALWILVAVKHVVGASYEPSVSMTMAQMSPGLPLSSQPGRWIVSAVTQMGLFFEYLRYWLMPNVSTMSVDLRVDFGAGWSGGLAVLRALTFWSCAPLAIWGIVRGGRPGILGFGLLYSWLMYLPELASVRFQEPFVLYRSYLWAPAYMLIALAPLSLFSRSKLVIAVAAIYLSYLFVSATNRLSTFSDGLHLWQDAAAKIPDDRIPGADRIYYNMARELLNAKRYREAMVDADKATTLNPGVAAPYFLKGQAALELNDYNAALIGFEQAIRLNPGFAAAYYGRGLVNTHYGRLIEADSDFCRSRSLGFVLAAMKCSSSSGGP